MCPDFYFKVPLAPPVKKLYRGFYYCLFILLFIIFFIIIFFFVLMPVFPLYVNTKFPKQFKTQLLRVYEYCGRAKHLRHWWHRFSTVPFDSWCFHFIDCISLITYRLSSDGLRTFSRGKDSLTHTMSVCMFHILWCIQALETSSISPVFSSKAFDANKNDRDGRIFLTRALSRDDIIIPKDKYQA